MRMTLQPAYGRDYTSRKAVLADFDADKDFIVMTLGHPHSGRPVSKSQLVADAVGEVNIRYASLRKVVVVKIAAR